MEKLAILVPANILKIRIEKLLPMYESVRVDFNSLGGFRSQLVQNLLRGVSFIILDLDNSENDSIELITNIRKELPKDEVPIIALGTSGEVSVISKAIASGCNDFILKPFDDETFVKKVALQLETARHKGPIVKVAATTESVEITTLQWSSDYKIGIQSIDDEHKLLIDNFAKLYKLMKSGHGHEYYQEMLLFLINYVDFHFKNEEDFQNEIGYPETEEHKKSHEYYRIKIADFYHDQKNRLPKDSDLIHLNLFIRKFLHEHILEEDKQIGEYYASQQGH